MFSKIDKFSIFPLQHQLFDSKLEYIQFPITSLQLMVEFFTIVCCPNTEKSFHFGWCGTMKMQFGYVNRSRWILIVCAKLWPQCKWDPLLECRSSSWKWVSKHFTQKYDSWNGFGSLVLYLLMIKKFIHRNSEKPTK